VAEIFAEKLDIFGAADEGESEIIEVVIDGPFGALPIALGDGGKIDAGVGEVDALAGLEDAADEAVALDFVAGFLDADEAEKAVFDVDAVADVDVVNERGDGGADAVIDGDDGLALDDECIAGVDGDAAGVVDVGDLAEADFGSAEIAEDGDGV